MYPNIEILGKSISSYWTMFLVGIILMIIMNSKRRRSYELGSIASVILAVLTAILGLLGAKILFVLENLHEVLTMGLTLGGVSFFGTLFLLPLALICIAPLFGMQRKRCLDFLTPAIILMLATLRIGCFLSNCCGGASLSLGNLTFIPPVQLIECVADLLVLVYILKFEKITGIKGTLYPLFMLFYGAIRFILEFFRIAETHFLFLSNGQWFSLLAMCIGGVIFFYLKRDSKD